MTKIFSITNSDNGFGILFLRTTTHSLQDSNLVLVLVPLVFRTGPLYDIVCDEKHLVVILEVDDNLLAAAKAFLSISVASFFYYLQLFHHSLLRKPTPYHLIEHDLDSMRN